MMYFNLYQAYIETLREQAEKLDVALEIQKKRKMSGENLVDSGNSGLKSSKSSK